MEFKTVGYNSTRISSWVLQSPPLWCGTKSPPLMENLLWSLLPKGRTHYLLKLSLLAQFISHSSWSVFSISATHFTFFHNHCLYQRNLFDILPQPLSLSTHFTFFILIQPLSLSVQIISHSSSTTVSISANSFHILHKPTDIILNIFLLYPRNSFVKRVQKD